MAEIIKYRRKMADWSFIGRDYPSKGKPGPPFPSRSATAEKKFSGVADATHLPLFAQDAALEEAV